MPQDTPRVVSLLPSATEIVHALGVAPVGTSHECDHPPEATDRPTVVESQIDADATTVGRSAASGGWSHSWEVAAGATPRA